jgi:protein-S-isoprenylcysteine O-methyltransferase Ste14
MAIKFEQKSFRERGGWWVIAQFALFGLILLTLTLNREPLAAIRLLGWVMVGCAVVIGGTGVWMLRDKLTALPAPMDGAVLHDRGPYAIVRHPIYTAVILGFCGLAVKGGNPLALILSLLLIPFFYAKTSFEERLLINRFAEYREYQQRVGYRVLPWIL